MPVLTSATPVYRRVMAAAGIDMCCASATEWGSAAREAGRARAHADLAAIGSRCREYACATYSKDEFTARFDAAFASAGFDV